jgi:hypothetical protein
VSVRPFNAPPVFIVEGAGAECLEGGKQVPRETLIYSGLKLAR